MFITIGLLFEIYNWESPFLPKNKQKEEGSIEYFLSILKNRGNVIIRGTESSKALTNWSVKLPGWDAQQPHEKTMIVPGWPIHGAHKD